MFIDVVVVLVVRIGTARTHLSYLVALKGVIARKNDSRKAKVFKVGDCISHSNKKYTTETNSNTPQFRVFKIRGFFFLLLPFCVSPFFLCVVWSTTKCRHFIITLE